MTEAPNSGPSIAGYRYESEKCGSAHEYLLPTIANELRRISPKARTIFDLGCGNGSVANWLAEQGHDVKGVDPSEQGIAFARQAFPHLDPRAGSAYDDLARQFGTFPVVISLEVVEHVYAPRVYATCVRDLLEPGGHALISTPYHGYLKNLLLAATGKLDDHFTALWDHGHIKFWSRKTLSKLLNEVGLVVECIHRVGRVPAVAKSMLVVARRPGAP